MAETILIAGGSGLLGNALCDALILQGYQVKLLGRTKKKQNNIETFIWDPVNGEMNEEALINTDYVINLAGANIGEGKWTEKRKKELIDSRTFSTKLLVNCILKNNYPIKKFIQASAIGYYGFSETDIEFTEEDTAGKDFLASLCELWEQESTPLQNSSTPVLILRIGVVLSNLGGALKEMSRPIKMFVGSPLGSGKQIVPWIHIDDMVSIFIKGIQDAKFSGTFNSASPNPISNKQLVKAIGKAAKRPVWPFGVPTFILKLLLGEQAQIVTKGNRVSAKKILARGFEFKHPEINEALRDLMGR